MKWYYQTLGGHTHVQVFMNVGKCGDLCFRNEEFEQIRHGNSLREGVIAAFINNDPPKTDPDSDRRSNRQKQNHEHKT